MENKNNPASHPVSTKKKAILFVLTVSSLLIILSGAFFSIFSYINKISFRVVTATVPGVVFGILVLYIGLHYFLMVRKLKPELLKPTAVFSWGNFKKSTKTKNK